MFESENDSSDSGTGSHACDILLKVDSERGQSENITPRREISGEMIESGPIFLRLRERGALTHRFRR